MTEEITYYINTDCINCGLCVKACPEHCIDVYKKPAVIDQSKCRHCGACAEVCPPGGNQRLGRVNKKRANTESAIIAVYNL